MTIQAKAFLLLAVFLIGLGAGYRVEAWHLTSKYEAEKAAQLKVNQAAYAALVAQRDAKAALLTAANDAALKQLGDSRHETARLRNRVDAGSSGLHINALCPTAGLVTQAASNPSVDIGTGAELDTTARFAYHALREAINTVEGKLAACQGELKLRQ